MELGQLEPMRDFCFRTDGVRGDETGWMPKVSWEDGVLQTIRWYADNRERWIGRVDWLPTGAPRLLR